MPADAPPCTERCILTPRTNVMTTHTVNRIRRPNCWCTTERSAQVCQQVCCSVQLAPYLLEQCFVSSVHLRAFNIFTREFLREQYCRLLFGTLFSVHLLCMCPRLLQSPEPRSFFNRIEPKPRNVKQPSFIPPPISRHFAGPQQALSSSVLPTLCFAWVSGLAEEKAQSNIVRRNIVSNIFSDVAATT